MLIILKHSKQQRGLKSACFGKGIRNEEHLIVKSCWKGSLHGLGNLLKFIYFFFISQKYAV